MIMQQALHLVEDEVALAPLGPDLINVKLRRGQKIRDLLRFMDLQNQYTTVMEARAEELLRVGVSLQLCHRRFCEISMTVNLPSVIGMTIRSFHQLFAFIEIDLQEVYPHCNSNDNGSAINGRQENADNRLRLFTILIRLKLASC